eukprot:TRINITY_DN6999_c0_g2_i5.p1 TRINITY_DN6999_c0_g2~~TRINITY_DN6999_c0_g2_i5.p1  ORF type:complete len:237 (-),score=-25.09 TRINITY_DN6999_c0_g2_i5:225-935(-)
MHLTFCQQQYHVFLLYNDMVISYIPFNQQKVKNNQIYIQSSLLSFFNKNKNQAVRLRILTSYHSYQNPTPYQKLDFHFQQMNNQLDFFIDLILYTPPTPTQTYAYTQFPTQPTNQINKLVISYYQVFNCYSHIKHSSLVDIIQSIIKSLNICSHTQQSPQKYPPQDFFRQITIRRCSTNKTYIMFRMQTQTSLMSTRRSSQNASPKDNILQNQLYITYITSQRYNRQYWQTQIPLL